MGSIKPLDADSVTDSATRQGFKVIRDALTTEPLINAGFKLIEIAFTQAGTFKVAHGLGFRPTDVLQSSLLGAGALTWNYASFDTTNLNITVSAACTVRAFVGAFRN